MAYLLASSFWIDIALSAGVVFLVACVFNHVMQLRYARIISDLFTPEAMLVPRDEEADSSAEILQFFASDGTKLYAALIKNDLEIPGAPVIVFCPEFGADKWSARHYCQSLLSAGFDVLSLDFGNQGQSDSRPDYQPSFWLTEFEVDDVLSLVDYAARDPELSGRVAGVMGVSRGAGAALIAAARRSEIAAIVVEAPFSIRNLSFRFVQRLARTRVSETELRFMPDWHIRWSIRKARRLVQQARGCRFVNLERQLRSLKQRPLLCVSGRRDSYVTYDIVKSVATEAGHAESSIWTVPGAKHNRARDVDPDGFDSRVVQLFSEAIGRPNRFGVGETAVTASEPIGSSLVTG